MGLDSHWAPPNLLNFTSQTSRIPDSQTILGRSIPMTFWRCPRGMTSQVNAIKMTISKLNFISPILEWDCVGQHCMGIPWCSKHQTFEHLKVTLQLFRSTIAPQPTAKWPDPVICQGLRTWGRPWAIRSPKRRKACATCVDASKHRWTHLMCLGLQLDKWLAHFGVQSQTYGTYHHPVCT